MSNRTIPETARVLIAAKKLIEDEDKWCQRALEKDGRYCALGALNMTVYGQSHSAGEAHIAAWEILDETARRIFGEPGIPSVNNELGFEAVMQMFDLAISRAIQQGESDG